MVHFGICIKGVNMGFLWVKGYMYVYGVVLVLGCYGVRFGGVVVNYFSK